MANRKRRIIPPVEQPIEKPIREVKPLNKEQADLIKVIHSNDIIFISGIAGGGKSYISAGIASEYLLRGIVDKVIISRPIVGAESEFGILPGDIDSKILPFLNPLLQEFSYFLNIKKYIAEEKLVIIPVSFMRGYTFKNSFVIIDESENLNRQQLKLILTRLGSDAKMILNGDFTQSDLNERQRRDFEQIIEKMRPLCTPEEKIAIFDMTTSVRSPRIKKILAALES